jgi:hypothetical protein
MIAYDCIGLHRIASDCALFLVGASTYEQAPMADHEASAGSAGNCAGAVASASELMGSLLGGQCHRSLGLTLVTLVMSGSLFISPLGR